MSHVSVLLHELVDGLALQAGNTILDCTLNGGGHSEEILKRWGNEVTIIGIDADSAALKRAAEQLRPYQSRVMLVQGNFRQADLLLKEAGVTVVDRVIYDLGLSSNQYDESHRGFTFKQDEPLLMTLNDTPGIDEVTAARVVNQTGEQELADLLFHYGEERYSRRIAKGIVEARKKKRFETTNELVRVIETSVPASYLHQRIHPATRTFQALRIAVNDEFGALTESLQKTFGLLSQGGRIGVITFHSLEDRIVKKYFQELDAAGLALRINKKVIQPTREEIVANPRSRSAKLRLIQKT